MGKIQHGEEARNKSISIKPWKISEVFEDAAKKALDINTSEAVSVLMIYFIKNKKNKKLLDELKKIKRDVNMHNVQIRPSF